MEQKPPRSLLTLVGKVTSSNEIYRGVRPIGTGFFPGFISEMHG